MKIYSIFRKLRLAFRAVTMSGDSYARSIGVEVGAGCRIYTRNFGSEPFLVSIGSRVTVTSGVQFITHDGSTWLVRDGNGRRFRFAPVTVGDDVFIGVNSIVLPGVSIGSRCVIGAGSVVTKSIPSGSVAVGTPARVVGTYENFHDRMINNCISEQDVPNKNSIDYRNWVTECLAAQERKTR